MERSGSLTPARPEPAGEQIVIARAAAAAMVSHARDEAPLECCGLLVGRDGRVERAHPSPNLLRSPTRFQIDPESHFAAIGEARSQGLAVIGAYHSHPGTGPVPSSRDVEEADDPSLVHVIVSLAAPPGAPPVLAAFRIGGGNFRELTIVLTR